jgi:ribonuclease BN (tRNA processing enzyme)
MRLTVLGSGAACPPPGVNSSGYLLEDDGQTLLLDCGHGIASAVLGVRPEFDIDHILITHMHADHFIDVIPLRFRVTREMGGVRDRQIQLHLPPGGTDALHQIMRAISFVLREYDPKAVLQLGSLQVRFAPAEHYVPAWSIRVDGSGSLVYTGDTAPKDEVTELARDCDLFVAEGTLAEPETGPVRGHLTPEQAAAMACGANAQEMLLTHFWYGTDLKEAERRAASVFPGPLTIASDGLCCEVKSRRID